VSTAAQKAGISKYIMSGSSKTSKEKNTGNK